MGYSTSSKVVIDFVQNDGVIKPCQVVWTSAEFLERYADGLPEWSWDYALIDITETIILSEMPSLELARNRTLHVGQPIALLGFQFIQEQLSITSGIVSSLYTKESVNVIQIDGSVNNGNSGGPLIDVLDNKVIGIISAKGNGLVNSFDDLVASFDENIKFIETFGNPISMGKFSLTESILVAQRQMKMTATNIRRSANVGIGYAYQLNKIIEFLDRR